MKSLSRPRLEQASGANRELHRWRRVAVVVASIAGALLVSPTAFAEVTFPGGWESGTLTGPGLWEKIQVARDDSIALVEDVVRQGRFAARIELRPGDSPVPWNGGSERAEAVGMTLPNGVPIFENAGSGTKYFGFSLRLSPEWSEPAWSSIVQLHGPDEFDAAAAFAFRVNAGRFVADVYAGDVSRRTGLKYDCGPATKGIWVDFIVRIDFAVDKSGSVTVWRRDEGQQEFRQEFEAKKIATLQTSGGTTGDHYWKAGFYRAAADDVGVIWLDGVTRADTLEGLVSSAFAPAEPLPPSSFRFGIKPSDMAVKTVGDSTENGGWVLFANGRVAHKITLPKSGDYDIEVVARGTRAGDAWPIMAIAIDGVAEDAIIVDSMVSRPYFGKFKNVDAGEREISLIFLNDGAIAEEDRNLYLDNLTIRSSGDPL